MIVVLILILICGFVRIYEVKKEESLNHRFFILMKIQADMEMPEGWGYIARFALDCTWSELDVYYY